MSAKTMRYPLGLVTVFFAYSALAQTHYALGPVESANSQADVVVLGQRFALDTSTVCTVAGKETTKAACSAALSRHAYVVVVGDAVQLNRASRITVLPFTYVPGASTVMLGARVTDVRADLGVVRLAGLTVDSTALLAYGAFDVALGAYLELRGTQPAFSGVVLADGLRFSASTITGTGLQTITGTGIQTITGTGIQTITGTGTQTITGTGIQAQTITGTGRQLETQTITGTGRQAQTITGTGRR